MPKYAYISNHRAPTLRDETRGGFIKTCVEGCEVFQKVVAAQSFYSSSRCCYDIVLVSGESPEHKLKQLKVLVEYLLWIGKAFAVLRVSSEELENRVCTSQATVKCTYHSSKDICFV